MKLSHNLVKMNKLWSMNSHHIRFSYTLNSISMVGPSTIDFMNENNANTFSLFVYYDKKIQSFNESYPINSLEIHVNNISFHQ